MAKKKTVATEETMFDIFAEFATDERAEVEGVRMALTPSAGVIVARSNNEKYARVLLDLLETHRQALDKNDDKAKSLDEEIGLQAMAEGILVGFYGPLSFKGEPLTEYSVDKAKELLKVRDFRRRIMLFATDIENYRVATEEDDKKN